MIHYPVEPRCAAWEYLRLGRPTSSDFDKIITAKGDRSKQAEAYSHRLIAERMLGHPLGLNEPSYQGPWMIRGQEIEDQAIDAYEFQTGMETSLGGFITDDAGRWGCSPDRLVGEEGILEMKAPSAAVQISYLDDPKSLEKGFYVQNQGQLLTSGRKWVDLVSYHPELPTLIRHVKPDQLYQAKLENALVEFCRQLDMMQENMERMYGAFKPIVIPSDSPAQSVDDVPDWLGASDDDVERMLDVREPA
jgi:hypothetical protein